MDVRLPNGVVLRGVPEGTTQDELRAIAIRNNLATAADFGETSEAAAQIPKGGLTAPAVGEPVRERTFVDAAIEGAMAVPALAAGARGLQAVVRGTRAAPYAARLAEAVIPQTGRQLIGEGVLGAAAGAAGELGARAVPEQYGPAGEIVGGTVGGLLGAGAMSMGRNIAETARSLPSLFSSSRDLASQVAQAAGQSQASRQAFTALQANPNLAGSVQRAGEIEATTGIALPMLAAANGDTTISSFLQSQIARGDNSPFTAALKRQYEQAEQQLSSVKGRLAPTMQEVDAYVRRKATETQAANQAIVNKAQATTVRREQGLENITGRIQELTDQLAQGPTKEDVGNRLVNLLKAKETSIRKELSPKYEELLDNAEASGVVLPFETAQGLRTYAQEQEYRDVFKTFPTLWSKVKTVFAKEEGDFSVRDLDSLKRETNAALRQATPGTPEYRILTGLRQQVDNALDTTDPSFATAYRALDQEYASRLGIPFRSEGVVRIDRSRFVEDTVPKLTKDTSGLKEALAIIGDSPEGLKIVEDAFLFDISKSRAIINTTTGELNVPQLRRYIAQNKDKIDLVPGLRERLEGIGTRVQELRDNRTAILNAEKTAQQEKVENLWSKAYGTTDGIRGLVANALNNPQELDKLLAVAGKDKVANLGIKSAMLEDILNAPGDRMDLFTANRASLEKVFGKQDTKLLGDLVEASQRLKDNPFAMRININTISKSRWEELTGTKLSTSAGEWRNQVMSAPRVFINHISRYFQKQTDDAETAEIQKFLLDPKALQQAAQFMGELQTRGFTDRAVNLMGGLMKNSATSYLFGGLVGAGVGAQERERTVPTYEPELIQGFGQ